MKARLAILAVITALAHLPAALAEDATCCCPRCNVVCVPNREIEQEKHKAFDVECKWICVPKIRFPWEPCCKPQCAYVRKVKVLKEIEYECPHCKYTWTATCQCPSCPTGACQNGACPQPVAPSTVDEAPLPPIPEPTARRVFAPLGSFFDRSK